MATKKAGFVQESDAEDVSTLDNTFWARATGSTVDEMADREEFRKKFKTYKNAVQAAVSLALNGFSNSNYSSQSITLNKNETFQFEDVFEKNKLTPARLMRSFCFEIRNYVTQLATKDEATLQNTPRIRKYFQDNLSKSIWPFLYDGAVFLITHDANFGADALAATIHRIRCDAVSADQTDQDRTLLQFGIAYSKVNNLMSNFVGDRKKATELIKKLPKPKARGGKLDEADVFDGLNLDLDSLIKKFNRVNRIGTQIGRNRNEIREEELETEEGTSGGMGKIKEVKRGGQKGKGKK
jgi:hypothetical protein